MFAAIFARVWSAFPQRNSFWFGVLTSLSNWSISGGNWSSILARAYSFWKICKEYARDSRPCTLVWSFFKFMVRLELSLFAYMFLFSENAYCIIFTIFGNTVGDMTYIVRQIRKLYSEVLSWTLTFKSGNSVKKWMEGNMSATGHSLIIKGV